MRRSHIILLFIIFLTAFLPAQFSRVLVNIDFKLLKEADRQKLSSLDTEIERFYTQGAWNENWNDLYIPLSLQLVIEGASDKGSVRTYNAQMMVTGGLDMRFFDKSVQFYYNAGTPLYYDAVVFEPLPFLLKYYGLIMLGAEVDTYEPMGGTNFLEYSRNIATTGSTSDYPRGWNERIKDLDQLISNYGLRKSRFSYYYGMDLFKSGEIEAAVKEFELMLNGIKESQLKDPRDPHTLYFLKVHKNQIAETFTILNRKSWLKRLIKLDPDNEKVYGAALESLK